MAPQIIIQALNAGLALVEALIPEVERLRLRGEISIEEQKRVLSRYQSLKTRADGQFKGPEWQIE